MVETASVRVVSPASKLLQQLDVLGFEPPVFCFQPDNLIRCDLQLRRLDSTNTPTLSRQVLFSYVESMTYAFVFV